MLCVGDADCAEVCGERHRPRFGARPLRPGDGACAELHDQEGFDQHWSAGRHTATSP